MKVAHSVVITPKRCGLYETTRELVKNLRDIGVDSRLVDPTKETNALYPEGDEDRGAPFADVEWARDADIIVSHSGLGKVLDGKPYILCAHGRPRHSFLSETSGSTPIYSYYYNENKSKHLDRVVTFWPEHIGYLSVMFPDKPVEVVTAPVDLDAWTPGPKKYDFRGKAGEINVVCTDSWRDDVDPYIPINAFALWAKKHPGAKLHLYAKPKELRGWAALIKRLQDDGVMGELLGWVEGLEHIYRAADFTLTANEIATRTYRESLACGCPVARVNSSLSTLPLDKAMIETRESAVLQAQQFDSKRTAEEFKRVLYDTTH